jgi:hypothetical protein
VVGREEGGEVGEKGTKGLTSHHICHDAVVMPAVTAVVLQVLSVPQSAYVHLSSSLLEGREAACITVRG